MVICDKINILELCALIRTPVACLYRVFSLPEKALPAVL